MCRENVCDAPEATSWAHVTAGLGLGGRSSVSGARLRHGLLTIGRVAAGARTAVRKESEMR